jgi:hypothetical protein
MYNRLKRFKMKELIQEIRKSRLKPEEVWFIDFIKDLEEVKSDKYPNSIFFKKNGEVVFKQDTKYMYLECNYNEIWSVFENKFSFEYDDIQSLIMNVVEEHLNWRGVTPTYSSRYGSLWWKSI